MEKDDESTKEEYIEIKKNLDMVLRLWDEYTKHEKEQILEIVRLYEDIEILNQLLSANKKLMENNIDDESDDSESMGESALDKVD